MPQVGNYWRFIAHLTQPAWLSVEGIGLIVLVLFSLAYIEQFARSLWRGKRRASATLGLGLFMALLAVAIVGGAWLAAGQQPTLAVAVVCAILGGIPRGLPWPSRCTEEVGCGGCGGEPRARGSRDAGDYAESRVSSDKLEVPAAGPGPRVVTVAQSLEAGRELALGLVLSDPEEAHHEAGPGMKPVLA